MSRNLYSLYLVLIDLFSYYLSLFLAVQTRSFLDYLPLGLEPYLHSFFHYLPFFWIPAVFVLFMAYEGLYTSRKGFWFDLRDIFRGIFVSMIVVMAIVSLGKMTDVVSRLTMGFLGIYSLFIFPVFRYFLKREAHKRGYFLKKFLVFGNGKEVDEVVKALCGDPYLGFKNVGIIDGKNVSLLTEELIKRRANFVIIYQGELEEDELSRITNEIHRASGEVMVLPNIRGISLLSSELYFLFFHEVFMLRIRNNLQSLPRRAVKRSFDIIFALFLLPVVIPLVALISLMIKLDSRGPVFFKQQRIGRGGKKIWVYKFRTMYVDAERKLNELLEKDEEAKREWEEFYKLKDDPRITKVGRLLRKTSLDELPQIFNVLKGDMSFVGPRPVLEEELRKYYGEYSVYYLITRPGITGLWQVSGRNLLSYERRVHLDVWYVLNWSLWLDVVILIKTIRAVFKGEGAY